MDASRAARMQRTLRVLTAAALLGAGAASAAAAQTSDRGRLVATL